MTHKLLLADDSVTIQRVIELTFADEDVQVVTAGDGEQAIARIQSDRPDIVLADIGMPKRSGYDVAAFVKNEPGLSHIPVLLMTGAFEPVDEGRAQAAGCDGVLVKPFEPQHVIARVRELLQGVSRNAMRPVGVTRAVSDVPRPAERLAPHRAPPPKPAVSGNGESFTLPARDVTPRGVADAGTGESSLDDYFDRLDAAFANMAPSADAPVPRQPENVPRREGPVMERDLDWFDTPSQSPAAAPSPQPVSSPHRASSFGRPDVIDVHPSPSAAIEPVPVSFATPPVSPTWSLPQPPSIEPPDSPSEIAPQTMTPTRAIHAPADTRSAIADAFSALLAAEQGEPEARPIRLTVSGATPPVTDEFVEEITRKVIERLGRQTVNDLVGDVVARVAERLVREEIGRIRRKDS